MTTAIRKPWITPDEYLALERATDARHEYVDGEVFAMGGGTLRHGEIALNVAAALRGRARERGCRTYVSDAMVRVDAANAYYYPDVVVTCDPPANDRYVVHAPTVIVEVLSDSTEHIDRREKRANYQTVASLREYILVAQDDRRVEVYRREPDGWTHEIVTAGEVALASLDATLALDDVYA